MECIGVLTNGSIDLLILTILIMLQNNYYLNRYTTDYKGQVA